MPDTALIRPPSPDFARLERITAVPDDLVEEFLAMYRAAFAPLEVLAPARQALTDDEFRHEMVDPSVMKFVAWDATGTACALAFVASDLATVPWISVPYFAARFPEHHSRGAIFYAGALLVRADRQGGPWAKVVVEDMFRYVAERRAILAWDCCGFNAEVVRMPESVARAAHRVSYAETIDLDQQRYYAYVMDGPR
jgi:hypothetical protein